MNPILRGMSARFTCLAAIATGLKGEEHRWNSELDKRWGALGGVGFFYIAFPLALPPIQNRRKNKKLLH